MLYTQQTGAIGALLDEYRKAVWELMQVIDDVNDADLTKIVDTMTQDSDCRSIQSVLAHVVCSAYGYAIYIQRFKEENVDFATRTPLPTAKDFQNALVKAYEYNVKVFETIQNNEIEELDNSKKIVTNWGQSYDIEQLMEHAIVHILRHRRQIEKFKLKIKNHAL